MVWSRQAKPAFLQVTYQRGYTQILSGLFLIAGAGKSFLHGFGNIEIRLKAYFCDLNTYV